MQVCVCVCVRIHYAPKAYLVLQHRVRDVVLEAHALQRPDQLHQNLYSRPD